MSERTKNLKSFFLTVGSKTSALNASNTCKLGIVPAGMTRWVTFLTVDNTAVAVASQVRLFIASVGVSRPTRASIVATGNRKYFIDTRGSGVVNRQGLCHDVLPPVLVPRKPDVNAPLFSIAGGKWIGMYVSNTIAGIFIQYYDE